MPAALPLIAGLTIIGSKNREYTDLTGLFEKRQKFDIIPFDGQHNQFAEVAEIERENQSEDSGPLYFNSRDNDFEFFGSVRMLNHVLEHEDYTLNRVCADEIKIYHRIPDVVEDETLISIERRGEIFKETNTDNASVILPNEGKFLIQAELGEHSASLVLNSNAGAYEPYNISDSWNTTLFYDSDSLEAPKLFLPLPPEGTGKWKVNRQMSPRNFDPDYPS
jgi:hypothetical protein